VDAQPRVEATRDGGAGVPVRRRSAPILPRWGAALGTSGILQVAAIAGLLVWLYWEHMYRLYSYWKQPDWSHGFLIPVFSLYIVHMRRGELLRGAHRGSLWGAAAMVVAVLSYAYFIRAKVVYPQPLSLVLMLAGIVLLLRGWRSLWLTLFPIGLLVLAIPPPVRLYRAVTQPLQQGAAWIAEQVLGLFPGVIGVERSGVNIWYYVSGGNEGTFQVAGACSGMRSLMAFVAIGLMLTYFTPRPIWQRVAMAAIVVPVALFCNVLRVLITGAFQMYGHGNLATGTPHMVLGLLMFALGLAIYYGVLYVFENLYVEADEDEAAGLEGAAT